jgi:pyruvate formate lyase activating enzyme
MNKELTGIVYDIQGFSLQDGPGIRTTIFLKGCPLRCPWCHSPESQQFYPQLSWISAKCIGIAQCGKCMRVCAREAIVPGKTIQNAATREYIQHIHVHRTLCDNCGDCAVACVYRSLYICGTEYTAEELIKRVSKDLPFYEQSGGGVTVSGGEPLSQPQFVLQLLKGLKACGIHTALDTTGHAPFKIIESVLPYTDLFLYDLKHLDSEQHRMITGVPNEQILENAKKIANAGGKIQIRIPVIPNFNDSEINIREIGEFCMSLGNSVTLIQLLPYHNLGVMKYSRLDDSKSALESDPPTEENIAAIKQILECLGLPVTVH